VLLDLFYSIPAWLLAVLCVVAWTAVSVGGLLLTRGAVARMWRAQNREDRNDIVGAFLGAAAVLYGLALGLIAVASWEKYSDVESRVSDEAATITALRSDVMSFQGPDSLVMRNYLGDYVEFTVHKAWPQQALGNVLRGDSSLIKFRDKLNSYGPANEGQANLQAEAMRQFNELIRMRRLRQLSTTQGLSAYIWVVVLVGGLLSIAITWLFVITPVHAHMLLDASLATLIGLLIFMVAAMDRPFRGSLGVTPCAFILSGAHQADVADSAGSSGGRPPAPQCRE
jgi:hypothetical protein